MRPCVRRSRSCQFAQDIPGAGHREHQLVRTHRALCGIPGFRNRRYAAGGYAVLTGAPDREPLKAYGSLVEYQAGVHTAFGVIAALHARARPAAGRSSMSPRWRPPRSCSAASSRRPIFYGKVARRNGTRLLGFPDQHSYPSTIRPCKDGCVHAHSNNRHLDFLAALIPHPRFSSPDLLDAMMGHADEIDEIMDDGLPTKRGAMWCARPGVAPAVHRGAGARRSDGRPASPRARELRHHRPSRCRPGASARRAHPHECDAMAGPARAHARRAHRRRLRGRPALQTHSPAQRERRRGNGVASESHWPACASSTSPTRWPGRSHRFCWLTSGRR